MDWNEKGGHVAVVVGGTVNMTVRREAPVKWLGRVVTTKSVPKIELVKVAAVQRVAKIIRNSAHTP